MGYLTESGGATGGSPASLDYVNTQALNKASPSGDSMAGPLTVPSLIGGGTAPVVAGVTHCVASAAVGHDLGGSFVLTTDSTSVTAGTIATVTFGNTYSAAPVAVIVTLADTKSGNLAGIGTVYATAISKTGFTVANSASMAASATFRVQYIVIAS
jgi:hypothetical protein